jgi:hypothetical protein
MGMFICAHERYLSRVHMKGISHVCHVYEIMRLVNRYCGETSFITSGLFYGQYLSQYDVRRLCLKGNTKQYAEESQILLGENDTQCAANLRLTCETYHGSDLHDVANIGNYMQWMKRFTSRYRTKPSHHQSSMSPRSGARMNVLFDQP